MKRKQWWLLGGAVAALAVVFTLGIGALLLPRPPLPTPIAKPLASLASELPPKVPPGDWSARHDALPDNVEQVIGADDYLYLKMSSPQRKYPVTVYVSYNADASRESYSVLATPLRQSGYEALTSRDEEVAVPGVKNGKVPVHVTLFKSAKGPARRVLLLQYFNVSGEYLANRKAAWSLGSRGDIFWRTSSYLSQTNVAVFIPSEETEGPFSEGSLTHAVATDVIRALAPLLEKEFYPRSAPSRQ